MTSHASGLRRRGASLMGITALAATGLLLAGTAANAANSPTVPMGTSAQYAVLGASTVTNTNASTLNGSLGLSPGTSITGFPPGKVVPPATINKTNAAAAKARADLTAAYLNAKGRPIDATTGADLANTHLFAGVYAGPSHGALQLTGPMVLDGGGDASSVFIFQTNSTLKTASSSTVSLVNGAQACNVFWQVGSSATLGTGSVFSGNILALTSITVTHSVTVHGRALARNGAVTLDNDTFTRPSCATGSVAGPTTTTPSSGTPTTIVGNSTGTGSGAPGSGGGSGTPGIGGPPRTDATPLHSAATFPWSAALIIGLFGGAITATVFHGRRRVPARATSSAGSSGRPVRG